MNCPGATARRRERNSRILLRVLERDPENLRNRFYLGLTHFEAERWDDAIPHLQAVVDQAGNGLDFLPKAYACLANSLLNARQPLQAEAILRHGLARFPHHPELWFCLGLVLDNFGRLAEAIAANEAALLGRFGPSLNWHDWACRESKPHIALCDLKLTMGEVAAAEEHLAAAERFTGPQPAYAQIREAIAGTREEHACRAADLQRMLAQYESQYAAGDRVAGERLITTLLEDGQLERARTLAGDCRGSAFSDAWAKIARGRVLLASGAPDEALECFRSVRESCPDLTQAWLGEARAWQALDRGEAAETTLLEALQRATEREAVNQALGELYRGQQRWDEAMRCFQSNLETQDEDESVWLGLGEALLRTGNAPAAIHCYQRAASLSGGGAAVRIALGEAREYLAKLRVES